MLGCLFLVTSVTAEVYYKHLSVFGQGPRSEVNEFPLKSIEINVTLLQNVATLKYELEYQNEVNDTLVDATLVLPFDTDTSIADLEMSIGNRVFKAIALDNTKAEEMYETKSSENKTATLVSWLFDSLQVRLASIPPYEKVLISFKATKPLPVLFNRDLGCHMSRFVLPLTYVTRYSSPYWAITSANIAHGVPSYTSIITIEAPGAKYFKSNIEVIDNVARFVGIPREDVIVDVSTLDNLTAALKTKKNGYYMTKMLFGPNLEETPVKDNLSIVFLVDRSGSMVGDPISRVKEAMEMFVHSLNVNISFDIIGFGSHFKSLFSQLRKYDDSTLEFAKQHINSIEADMGGTEILAPLEYILPTMKPDVCILLTDGAVTNTQSVLDYVSQFPTRIFTLGIGNAASVDLVRGIARKTGGSYEIVHDVSNIEGAVIRSLQQSTSPYLSNLTFKENNCGIQLLDYPRLISSSSINEFVFLSHEDKVCTLEIEGYTNDNTLKSYTLTSDKAEFVTSVDLFSPYLTRSIGSDMIDKTSSIEIAMLFNLITKYTSLVVCDEEVAHNFTSRSFINIPLSSLPNTYRSSAMKFAGGRSKSDLHFMSIESDQVSAASGRVEVQKPDNKCRQIVALQKADGSWNYSDAIKEIIKHDNDSGYPDILAYTALCIKFIKQNCTESVQLVLKKAEAFIMNKLSTEDFEKLMKWTYKV